MASPTATMPTRTKTDPDDDVIPDEDTGEVTKLFHERLQAYKHACGYIEDYIQTTEKMQNTHQKEYEKVLKTISQPLREGEHFDAQLGGINEMFESLRTNTQGIANQHAETAKTLKGSVLPVFERLHAEIKSKQKELAKGVGKGQKAVDKARSSTQKHVELLGQHAAAHGGLVSSKSDPSTDPYVLHKGVFHRLNKQIIEENNTRQDMLTVQSNFSQFEAHIVQTFQQGMGHFLQALSTQLDSEKALYTQMTTKTQSIDPLFEWQHFVSRKSDVLIDPNAPPRSLDNISFPNQDHATTQALIQGQLERRSGLLKKYDAGFYAVTPAKYLHEFKSDDNLAHDPKPETSLYLPDCAMGGLNGAEFNIKGKDLSGGKVGAALATKSEYRFKARTDAEAEQWYNVIAGLVNSKPASATDSPVSSPASPAESRNVSGAGYGSLGSPQEVGTTAAPTTAAAAPASSASGIAGEPGKY